MHEHIRALIFDVDGILTDTAEGHYQSWKRMADEEGYPFTREDNEALRGVSRRESLRRLLKGREVSEEHAQALMRRKNEYFQTFLNAISPADRLPGVTELLSQARDMGLRLAVASASRNARMVIDRLELGEFFDAIADAHTVVNTKPAPDQFVWIAGRLNVSPQEAVVFEDAESGIQAALKGGFYVVGVGNHAQVMDAHLILPDLRVDLKELLAQIRQVAVRMNRA